MARSVLVQFIGDTSKLRRSFKEAWADADTFSKKTQTIGRKLTTTLTPAAAVAGVAFKKAFDEVDAGADAIVAGTGASGDALKEMNGIMKDVAKSSTQSFGTIGQDIADLNKSLGLTGEPLKEMTQRMSDLRQLNVAPDIAAISRVTGSWHVKAEEQAATLDKMFRVGQLTGKGINDLAGDLVKSGTPLRAFGFSLDDSIALLGRWQREGVNTDKITAALRAGLGKMAKAGKDPQREFPLVVAAIKAAGSAAAANTIAVAAFGAKAGPDLAAAIREGKLSVGELGDQLNTTSKDSIATSAAATLDLGDRVKMFGNRIKGVIGPVGEVGFGLSGIAGVAGPLLTTFGKMIAKLPGLTLGMEGLSAATLAVQGAAVLAVGALGVMIGLKVADWINKTLDAAQAAQFKKDLAADTAGVYANASTANLLKLTKIKGFGDIELVKAELHKRGVPGFALGGIVPGPMGAPMAAIVHGGEEITPANRRGGGGVTIIVQGSVITERQLSQLMRGVLLKSKRNSLALGMG